MYIRFATLKQDEDSHSPTGVFQAAFAIRDSGKLADYEETQLNQAFDWLNMHLKVPACLIEPENRRAISWFHPSALKPMQYIWQIVQILKEHGVFIKVYKNTDPGIVIYEDGWQVVAKPRRKKRRA